MNQKITNSVIYLLLICLTLAGCGKRVETTVRPNYVESCSLAHTIDDDGTSVYKLICEKLNGETDMSKVKVELFEPEVIELCPETYVKGTSEILLRLGAQLFAVYAGPSNQVRLVEIAAGNWLTTDGRSCRFEVTEEGEVIYE